MKVPQLNNVIRPRPKLIREIRRQHRSLPSLSTGVLTPESNTLRLLDLSNVCHSVAPIAQVVGLSFVIFTCSAEVFQYIRSEREFTMSEGRNS